MRTTTTEKKIRKNNRQAQTEIIIKDMKNTPLDDKIRQRFLHMPDYGTAKPKK